MEDEDRFPEPDTISIAVFPPVLHGGREFASLDLREPRVSEVRASEELLGGVVNPASVLESEVRLAALVSGWPEEAIRELPASLLNQAADFLGGFEARARGARLAEPTLLIELDPPVVVQKGSFAELELREPRVSERRRAELHLTKGITVAASRAAEISLVTDVSAWPPAAVLKMPIGAFARAADYLAGFLERGRRTGASSRAS